jgi:Nucleotidyl transferase AbiEii toxin, Type IV TA system
MTTPARPTHLSEFAERTLQALAAAGLGHALSLGGALGLIHYLDYRSTHDVDAWWSPAASAEDRQRVMDVIQQALRGSGEVRVKSWGEVVSIELRIAGKTVFSFQVAERSAQLEPTTTLPWADVSLDSLPDLVASKMVALVERGAPRDFRDIDAVCRSGLMSASECWRLWALRQQQSDGDGDRHRSRVAVATHLARIMEHRPLDRIEDPGQRAESARIREWFETELLDALMD